MAKAFYQFIPDSQVRKRGEQRGLDIPVVHALNDAFWVLDMLFGA
jgi:hypothetical protein